VIAARPGAVRGFMCDAEFWDVGTVTDYWKTSQTFAARDGATTDAAHAPSIDRSARVTRSILWDDVTVDAGAVVDECIVADGVRIPRGAAYRHRAIVAGANGEPIATAFDTEIR
jgi:NDP-sugar pyrophosphorylase family protein